MSIETKLHESYLNFGRCLEISNEKISLLVTVDVGPRIIKFGFKGGTNLLFNDIDRAVTNSGKEYDDYYYKGAAWYIYGGHRLWISPESSPETYYPDNNPVSYDIIENGAIFTQEPQKQNGVQFKIKVELDDINVTLTHLVTNIGDKAKTFSPWAITVLNKGGLEIIPQNPGKKGLLPNRRLIMWPYSNMADSRVFFGEDYITLKQDTNAKCNFKLGLDNQLGMAFYVLDDTVFLKKYTHDINAVYDDFGASFETYTSKDILEMETLGKIVTANPGDTITHTEKWSLFKNTGTPNAKNEEEIDNFIKQYMK